MSNVKNNLLKDLNEEQKQAVIFEKGPLLILAGAGSGKTKALVHRAAYLLQEKNVPAERILLVTFTNKAAGEMQQRLQKLVGTRLPFAGTFHSFCAKLLRREGRQIGIPVDFSIYDNKDQLAAVKLAMKRLDIDAKEFSSKSMLYSISAAKNELFTTDDYIQFARGRFQQVVAKVYEEYQKLLKKFRALDFDDLLFETVRLLKTSSQVRKKYQKQFLHILVDEYQDTNKAQYELTRLLVGKDKNLSVVGDASQAIYGWRGADYRNLMLLKTDFPDLTTMRLTQNYRSTQTILDAAHGVISNNTTHPILNLWTEAGNGNLINLYEARNERDEARFILNKILKSKEKSENYKLRDFVVLYRTNAQSRVFEDVFMRAGIPYELVGGVEFYQRKEIKDVLAYLRLIINIEDQVSYQRAEKVGKRRLRKFLDWLKKANTKRPPLELLDQVLETTDYMGFYDEKIDEDMMRIENIKELRSVASEFHRLTEFLENVALVQNKTFPDRKQNEKQSDAVTFMTLHSSKGLEFEVVFLAGMEEGLFPHSRSMLSKEELEEERRLCYVGMTRAKKQLFLTHAKQRLYFGTTNSSVVSRFLGEIPEQALRSVSITRDKSRLIDQLLNDELDIEDFLGI